MRLPEYCYRVRTKDEKGTEEEKEETRKFTHKVCPCASPQTQKVWGGTWSQPTKARKIQQTDALLLMESG